MTKGINRIGSFFLQCYKVEEHEKIIQDQPGEIRQEKTVVVSQDEEGIKRDVKSAQMSKPSRKCTAPRFVSPITGMIVDQGTDIILEGIIDGKINISFLKILIYRTLLSCF